MFQFYFLRRVLSKPISIIFFRLKQDIILRLTWAGGVWGKMSANIEKGWQSRKSEGPCSVLIYEGEFSLNSQQHKVLSDICDSILSDDFEIFETKVGNLDICDFSKDWRFNKKWNNKYYKKYKFYEEKFVPYDVKFPWELSRLFYLVPLFARQWATVIEPDVLDRVKKILYRWRENNLLAYSVNWYPMEASMRVVSLVLMLDFVRLLQRRETEKFRELESLERQLAIMIAEHGHFIWLNREFTDVRGNHFTANLVALLLASCSLGFEDDSSCKKWLRYAIKWLDKEISLQFYNDGVNFEKSCGYHKLVLELFMLAAIVRDRIGKPFEKTSVSVLEKAACYSDAIMRPDGVAANFGDIDDAIALPFLINNPRSHGSVIELARTFFNKDLGTVAFEDKDKLASLFLLGSSHQRRVVAGGRELFTFADGGYVIVRCMNRGFFFMADVGEVGMAGRGGHGHNDLLSFELCIDGQAIVVDPGCSGYTADLVKMKHFRSTFNHSTIGLWGKEMARFSGHWTICNDALPLDINVAQKQGVVFIRAGHDGYERIAQGTKIYRTFHICPENQEVIIKDEVGVGAKHAEACWNFPLGECAVISSGPHSLTLRLTDGQKVDFESELEISLLPYQLSYGYGQEVTRSKIVSRCVLTEGEHSRIFRFHRNSGIKR